MDTKLKSISRKKWVKCIAFALATVFITLAFMQLVYIKYINVDLESIIVREYRESKSFAYEVNKAISTTYKILESNTIVEPGEINYFYLIKDDERIFSNAPIYYRNFFERYKDTFFSYENGMSTIGKRINSDLIENPHGENDYTMYIAFPDTFMEEHQRLWNQARNISIPIILSVILCLVLSLLLLIYLGLVSGRKIGEAELYTSWMDNLYTEIILCGFIPMIIWILTLSKVLYYDTSVGYGLSDRQIFNMCLIGIVTVVITIISILAFLSIVRKVKGRNFYMHSIMSKIVPIITAYIKNLFDGNKFKNYPLTKRLHKRQVTFIILSAILVLFMLLCTLVPYLMILPIIIEAIIIYWYVKYNNETFDEINEGFNESIKEQMKAERMKINLITNVSHDLKTPLTSIISYVDLLSKEEDLSEAARDYVRILTEKSNRLKNILGDIFELAKSTSGDVNLEMEMLDLKKLIEQTLGDMQDDIEKSGFQIITKLPKDPIYIVSDGKRLYRVFQNIIDNALKYSLQGTRIFIEAGKKREDIFVILKNIAGYEMNFTAEEILQRFNRGDKSRNTDGSGLGLSIAESFTKVCGGDFKVDIDGDMFKVIISFKNAN
ncbi:sensor histidine kinase [Paratissierella segnis]|uniref:histidine kinase n=1 Tax=Paratissierella segnis TaxID=2763679 RepID=A0A926IJF4_9FIRM|nr:HAMP domain-containing sensor histidine kinase [Paratissierella segnis]MBC8587969.1 HAMP domain-containing histidine kinase [Paratissierella segnis]